MKHSIFKLILPVLMVCSLILVGCGEKSDSQQTQKNENEKQQDCFLPTVVVQNTEGENSQIDPGDLEAGVPTGDKGPRSVQRKKGTGIDDLASDPGKADELLLNQRMQVKNSKWQIQRETPVGSTAEQLAKNSNRKFVWSPTYTGNLIDPIFVQDVQISPDRSVLVFVEWYPSKNQYYGTYLIFMDTATWKFIDCIDVPQRKIKRVVWLSSLNSIAGVCEHQPHMAQPCGIVKIDLESKKETGFIRTSESTGMRTLLPLDGGNKIIASHAVKQEILLIDCNDLERNAVQHIPVPESNSICVLSKDEKKLAVASPKARRIFVYATEDMKQIADKRMPDNYPLEQFVFLENGKDFFITAKSALQAKGYLLRNTLMNEIAGHSDGMAVLAENGKSIYHLLIGREISVIDSVTGQENRRIKLDTVVPALKNPSPGRILKLFVFPEIEGLAVFDANGNFYLISMKTTDKKGKNAERILLFTRKK